MARKPDRCSFCSGVQHWPSRPMVPVSRVRVCGDKMQTCGLAASAVRAARAREHVTTYIHHAYILSQSLVKYKSTGSCIPLTLLFPSPKICTHARSAFNMHVCMKQTIEMRHSHTLALEHKHFRRKRFLIPGSYAPILRMTSLRRFAACARPFSVSFGSRMLPWR